MLVHVKHSGPLKKQRASDDEASVGLMLRGASTLGVFRSFELEFFLKAIGVRCLVYGPNDWFQVFRFGRGHLVIDRFVEAIFIEVY